MTQLVYIYDDRMATKERESWKRNHEFLIEQTKMLTHTGRCHVVGWESGGTHAHKYVYIDFGTKMCAR
jgi:hypothetical protein